MKYKVGITWSCDRHDNSTDDDIFEVDDLEKYLPSLVGKLSIFKELVEVLLVLRLVR